MATPTILASPRQRGNPVLRLVSGVTVQFSPDVKADFELAPAVWALFISTRFHVLHPGYLATRVDAVRRHVKQLVVLCLVDMEDCARQVQEVSMLALARECTCVVASRGEEAARYLEAYAALEGKPAAAIQERAEAEHAPRAVDLLTCVRSVNKTDALTLMTTFGSLADVMRASPEALASCVGFGEKKVRRVYDHFHSSLRSACAEADAGGAGGGAGGVGRP